MAANTSSRVTTDHDAIRRWAEERGAKPVLGGKTDRKPGQVRLEFPDSSDRSIRKISWSEWFQRFDRDKLAFLYQQQTANGERSTFCELVPSAKADQVERAVGGRGRSATRRGKPRESKSVRLHPAAEPGTSPAKKVIRIADSERIAIKTSRPRKPATKPGRGEAIASN